MESRALEVLELGNCAALKSLHFPAMAPLQRQAPEWPDQPPSKALGPCLLHPCSDTGPRTCSLRSSGLLYEVCWSSVPGMPWADGSLFWTTGAVALLCGLLVAYRVLASGLRACACLCVCGGGGRWVYLCACLSALLYC